MNNKKNIVLKMCPKKMLNAHKSIFLILFFYINKHCVPLWNQYVSGIGLPTTFKSNLAVCPCEHLTDVGFSTKTGLYSLSSCPSSVSSNLRAGEREGELRAGEREGERGEIDLEGKKRHMNMSCSSVLT